MENDGHLPISVSTSNTTAAGPIRGNIKANNDANAIARMQAPFVKDGSYVLGYTAAGQCQGLQT